MYRIELTPGEEALFRNIEEFAKAIHSGAITSHARIWHAASGKWLPIDFHPHYKIARQRPVSALTAMAANLAPATAAPPVSPFAPPAPTPVSSSAPRPVVAPTPVLAPAPIVPAETPVASAPAPVAVVPAPVAPAPVAAKTREIQFIELGPAAAPKPQEPMLFIEAPAQAATPRHIEALVAIAEQHPVPPVEVHEEVLIDISSPRRQLNPRLVGIAAGVLLAAAAGGALLARGSAPAEEPETEIAVASTSLAATPKQGFEIIPAPEPGIAFRGNRAAEPVPEPIEVKDTTPAPVVVPNAPSLSAATLRAGSADIVGGIHDDRAELEGRLRASGFTNLFAPSRLAAGSVGATRLAVAGASGLVRGYRAKATVPESNAGARTADALLADIDAVLAILAAQEGGYEIVDGTITFRESASARQYGVLSQRIGTRIAGGRTSDSPVTESLVRSLGSSRLPELAGSR